MSSGRSRTSKIHADTSAALKQTAVKRVEKREKAEKVKPWKVLKDDWLEAMALSRGGNILDLKDKVWTPTVDKELSIKLVDEFGIHTATKMVRHFVHEWCPMHHHAPSFRFLWAVRAQIAAEVEGGIASKRERLDNDEFNAERASDLPDIGWGDPVTDTDRAGSMSRQKRENLDNDEFNAERAKDQPDIGWGDSFGGEADRSEEDSSKIGW